MYLIVEDNPNCRGDERMFAESGEAREVELVRLDRPDGTTGWCEVVAVNGSDAFAPARARQVEDSAAGVALLVRGGDWGLRLRAEGAGGIWAVDDPTQWGVPFLVLDESPEVVKFR
jgi:hypothetical protein